MRAAEQCADYLQANPSQIQEYLKITDSETLKKYRKYILLPGHHNLANGDVLKAQLSLLASDEKEKILIIGLGLTDQDSKDLSRQIGVDCISFAGLSNIQKLVAVAINALNSRSIQEIVWWSAPTTLTHVFHLYTTMHNRGFGQKNRAICSWATVKHHSYFSSAYLDRIYTLLPKLQIDNFLGFEDIKVISPYMYQDEILNSINLRHNKNSMLYTMLSDAKQDAKIIATSMSRPEKTDTPEFVAILEHLFDSHPELLFLAFGRSITATQSVLIRKYPKQFIHCGWKDDVIDLLSISDVFLDPIPFGAGMTMAAAAANSIPIISTKHYVSSSPSTISLLNQYIQDSNIKISQSLDHMIFGSISTYVARASEVIRNLNHLHDTVLEMKTLCHQCLSDDKAHHSMFV